MSYPYAPHNNFNRYLHTETFNYTRDQPLHDLMNRPEMVDYRVYPDPNNQQMDQIYYGNDQRAYNRPQQILYAPQPRAFNLNEEREYPSNQVTARIRLSDRRYTSAGSISALRRSLEWVVTVVGAFEITVTGYPTGRDGQREFLRRVREISGDRNARLC